MDPEPTTAMRPLARAISGAAALALAMGVGRFAYTALLPSVQRGIGLDDAAAGAVASMNLVGYLAGVVWARGAVAGRRRTALLRVGLVASVLTTAAVAGSTGLAGWIGLRFLFGRGERVVRARLGRRPGGAARRAGALAGVLYAGVGCGMALSARSPRGPPTRRGRCPGSCSERCPALAVPAWRQARPGVGRVARSPLSPPRDGVSLGRLGAAYFPKGSVTS